METIMPEPETGTPPTLTKPVAPLAVTIPEAARLLGLSPHTIRFYVRKGKITPVRFGRRVSIPMTEIERLAREGVPANPETPSKEAIQ